MAPWTQSRPAWLAGGALAGLIVGMNLSGLWPSIPLHATATQGLDKFAIATGLVDDSVEAIYFLDFLTGDLSAAVINPEDRQIQRDVFAQHRCRLRRGWRMARDTWWSLDSPTCRAAARTTNTPRASSTWRRPAAAKVAAYTIPWNSAAQAAGKPQRGEFQPLDAAQFRTAFIRDEP